jgi:aryl-alcohol dehydrogenase-like predicted oxidoreductase
VYSRGESEEIVGKALAGGKRDNVVLATKVHGRMGDDPNEYGNSRRWIVREVENSLRRLKTDWIDLYQIHRPEPETDIDDTLGALTDLVRAGKVRYIGSSTFQPSEVVEAQWTAERRGRERFVTEQPPYSERATPRRRAAARRCCPSATTCRCPRTSASSTPPTPSRSSPRRTG